MFLLDAIEKKRALEPILVRCVTLKVIKLTLRVIYSEVFRKSFFLITLNDILKNQELGKNPYQLT